MHQASALQRVLKAIARDAIALGIGNRLPTTIQYQQSYDVGSGTVQKALDLLQNSEALQLASRGHQGRQIIDLNIGRLWSVGNLPRIRIALPPPGPAEVWGLIELFRDTLNTLEVPLSISHARGAKSRVDALLGGRADVALLSRVAAAALGVADDPRYAIMSLGEGSYYAEGSIILLRRVGAANGNAPLRVGIDRTSDDHVRLTLSEFPEQQGCEYVDCQFPNMPTTVLEKLVDVGIWHRMLLMTPLHLIGLRADPLTRPAARSEQQRLSEAVLVFYADRAEIAAVLRTLDIASLPDRQRRLLEVGVPAGDVWLL
jgi:hypothetical protein